MMAAAFVDGGVLRIEVEVYQILLALAFISRLARGIKWLKAGL
jgi:hypothetical protein